MWVGGISVVTLFADTAAGWIWFAVPSMPLSIKPVRVTVHAAAVQLKQWQRSLKKLRKFILVSKLWQAYVPTFISAFMAKEHKVAVSESVAAPWHEQQPGHSQVSMSSGEKKQRLKNPKMRQKTCYKITISSPFITSLQFWNIQEVLHQKDGCRSNF